MSLFNESFAIFRRNALTSVFTMLLIVGASLGQVISLGSLYPILQLLVSDSDRGDRGNTIFMRVLTALHVVPSLGNLLALFVVIGVSYSALNWLADAFQARQLRIFETAVRTELFESTVMADWTYGRTLKHGEFMNIISREASQYQHVVKYALY